jgi:DNA-binding response OmpR family regulator
VNVAMAQRKVLIVEDDADIRGLLNMRLRQHAFETAFATDGMTALSIARKEEPDLILLDLGLPAGDGFTVMERMKSIASLAAVPVVVITARDATGNYDRAVAAGAAAFVQKPIDFDELLAKINDLLG